MALMRRTWVLLSLALLLAGSLAAACAAPAAPPAPTPTKAVTAPAPAPTPPLATPTPAPAKPTATPAPAAQVVMGVLGIFADLPFFIAQEKGYFREQGIDAKIEQFRADTDMIAPLGTGQLHVGGASVSVPLLNAVTRGVEIKSIANRSQPEPGYDTSWWMVRADLKDQIKGFADFKGKTVNMFSPGGIAYYSLGVPLRKVDLGLKDVNIVLMDLPSAGTAFKNKAIDVSVVMEPLAVAFQEQGLAVKWKALSDGVQPLLVATILASEGWLKANPELGRKFAVAYLKGTRDYLTAMYKGPNRAEIVNIAIKYTAVKDPAMYEKMDWLAVPGNGYVDKETFKKEHDWFFENGLLEGKADIEKLVDNSYMEYANRVLGEFKR